VNFSPYHVIEILLEASIGSSQLNFYESLPNLIQIRFMYLNHLSVFSSSTCMQREGEGLALFSFAEQFCSVYVSDACMKPI